jgi:hypothetical protein
MSRYLQPGESVKIPKFSALQRRHEKEARNKIAGLSEKELQLRKHALLAWRKTPGVSYNPRVTDELFAILDRISELVQARVVGWKDQWKDA